jgi:putative colanic acid biosynthesis acetyltransferase WcaF
MAILDARIHGSRHGGATFSIKNRLQRFAFVITWFILAQWTPRQAMPWRALILRAFGADIGYGAMIYGSVSIWLPSHLVVEDNATIGPRANIYSMAMIRIGPRAIVSQRAHLCSGTHDHRDPHFQLKAKEIVIGEDAWIATEAFVGPGVKVGAGAVLGARGCAFEDLEPWTVYLGNPAQAVANRVIRQLPAAACE